MNHKILFLLFLVLTGVLSCSKTEEIPTGLIETVESLSFTAQGGSRELDLATDGCWEVWSSDSWCTVYPSGGSGRIVHDQSVTVICDPNEGPVDRSCYLLFRTATQSVSVRINQETKDGFYLPSHEIQLSTAAQVFQVEYYWLNESVTYELSEDCISWLEWAPSLRSMSPVSLALSVSENTSSRRVGTILFSSQSKTETFTVIQDADDISIPDHSFRYWCVLLFDMDRDGHISRDEAAAARRLFLPGLSYIHSVSGAEYFTGLEEIQISFDNHISNLVFRAFKKLRTVVLDHGSFDTADFTECVALTSLSMYSCRFPGLLNASGLKSLTNCHVTGTPVEQINLKGCSALQDVFITANDLIQELDLSDAASLQSLDCRDNPNLRTVYLKTRPEKLYYDLDITTIVYVE